MTKAYTWTEAVIKKKSGSLCHCLAARIYNLTRYTDLIRLSITDWNFSLLPRGVTPMKCQKYKYSNTIKRPREDNDRKKKERKKPKT